MAFLDTAGEYEKVIKRGRLHVRTRRLDALVDAIEQFVKTARKSRLVEISPKLDQWKREDPKEFADRGQGTELALRKEIADLLHNWGDGEIRIEDASCHPRWEPHIWNDNGRIQYSTNCYAYACNDPQRHNYADKPQPGQFAERAVQDMDHAAVRYAVMADDLLRSRRQLDRLVPLIRLRNEPVPERVLNVPGYYLIALVTAPMQDYHWARQDDDGTWSHKPGWEEATALDGAGKPIYDPRDALFRVPVEYDQAGNVVLWAKYEFSTFYYAPRGGVRTGNLGTARQLRVGERGAPARVQLYRKHGIHVPDVPKP